MKSLARITRFGPLVFLAVFFINPVVTILARGLTDDNTDVIDVLAASSLWKVVWFTTWQAAVSTAVTVVVAMPAAWVLAHRRFRGRSMVRAAVIVPFVLPTVVVATAFTAILRVLQFQDGPPRRVGSVVAIVLAHVFFNYAIVVRTVATVWGRLDVALEHEAQMLGATPWQAFRRVTLPRLTPAVLGSASIVFLFSFTSFGVILLLGGPGRATLDTEVWRFAIQRGELAVASVIASLQLAAVVAALVLNTMFQRRYMVTERARADRRATRARGRREVAVQGVCLASMAVIVAAPLGALVERSFRIHQGYSFRWYRELFADAPRIRILSDTVESAIVNSLWIAAVATLIATVVGIGAVIVVQGRGWLGTTTEIAFLLPLGTSGVLLGLGFLVALDEPPLDLRTSWVLMPLAHALIGLPFVLRAVQPVVRSIDSRLREAATMLGATPVHVWRHVDLPIIWRSALIGTGFAFAVSLGEFGATAFVARPDRLTVPVAIFRLLSRPGGSAQGQAMALSVILMVLTAASVMMVERLRPKGADGW